MLYQLNGISPRLGNGVFIADNASVIADVRLGDDSSIWFGAVLRGDINYIEIGCGSNIQDLCVCHTSHTAPLIIGAGVTVGHSAQLHSCVIEDYCLIGIGAIALDGAVIGAGSIIAAGALIPPNTRIPSRSFVLGAPAKTRRKTTDKELEKILKNCRSYIELKNGYISQESR